jgi:MscS family membrane protein
VSDQVEIRRGPLRWRLYRCACALVLALLQTSAYAQGVPAGAPPAATQAPEPAEDELGRSTPRGTVSRFLVVARRGEFDVATRYLNTRLARDDARELAQALFVVLDARLPAELPQLSNERGGSTSDSPNAAIEIVGDVFSNIGPVQISLERVQREKAEIWLFSRQTLDAVPAVYEEITLRRSSGVLPQMVTTARVGGIRVLEWAVILAAFATLYLLTVLLNKICTALFTRLSRRTPASSRLAARGVLPTPLRLLIVAQASHWLLTGLPFSLLMRQFWSALATLVTIGCVVWLLFLLIAEVERHLWHRTPYANAAAAKSLLRIGRRAVEFLILFVAILACLRSFGIDPTPALAGLGVGGIAVALAAQKTLENVIAGASLIFDQAVRVGDFLRMDTTVGTVDYIGLRSTRIRTLDRTLVSIPNSQIANTSLETISARDMCWFHPTVGLRYDTTPAQLRTVIDGLKALLTDHPLIAQDSVRVQFIRLGAFSLDIEISCYIRTPDWREFLEIQEQLLLSVTEIVERAGAAIAFPTQTTYIEHATEARFA